MKRKNLVIALVVSLAVTSGTLFTTANPTNVGSNEVSEVPAINADVPLMAELPLFKYSHVNEMALNVQKGNAEATKKETQVKKVEPVKPVKQAKVVVESVNKKAETTNKVTVTKKVESFRKYEIPLSASMQSLIWELCKKEKVDYELVLAIISVESSFRANIISWDGSSMGLMQVNKSNTWKSTIKELGMHNANIFNPEDNVRVGIHHIATLYDAWDSVYSGSILQKQVLLSYRFGVAGSKKRSVNSLYVKKVESIQRNLRTKGVLE